MFNSDISTIQLIAVAIVPVLLAIIVHEIAHGWVALQLGDDTAYRMGRLTFNPIKHIDPIGTILVPLVLILTVNVAFGWAKPVPVNFNRLHNHKRDTALVAFAGPFANLLMAIIWIVIAKIANMLPETLSAISSPLLLMSMIGVVINSILMVFNLIPIPPTDGGRIATSLLPPRMGYQLSRIEPYGLIIILVLLLSGILWKLFDFVIQTALQLVQFAL